MVIEGVEQACQLVSVGRNVMHCTLTRCTHEQLRIFAQLFHQRRAGQDGDDEEEEVGLQGGGGLVVGEPVVSPDMIMWRSPPLIRASSVYSFLPHNQLK